MPCAAGSDELHGHADLRLRGLEDRLAAGEGRVDLVVALHEGDVAFIRERNLSGIGLVKIKSRMQSKIKMNIRKPTPP